MEGFVYTVPMALSDYVPVVLFGISAVLLCRDLKNKMTKGTFATLCVGTAVAFLAGFLKATYKLLIATGVGELAFLNDSFLPLQSPGLLLTGLALVLMLALRKKSAALAMAPATMGFISMMVLGLGGMCASLSIVSVKMKKKLLIPCSSSASSATWAWAISPRRRTAAPPPTGSSRASIPSGRSCCFLAWARCTRPACAISS